MPQTNLLYQETIYDLAIRLYGDILGVGELIHNFSDIDGYSEGVITYEEKQFPDYIPPDQPEEETQKITHIVRDGQSIYDLAIQLTGNIDGLSEIIANFESIDQDKQGDTIIIDQNEDEQLLTILNRGYMFSTRSEDVEAVFEFGIFEQNIFS